ncbi:MAG: T9SS type A sorting domain-containing protein [Candidatus Azobacteroides sp.]|nr:T9SS type A sorting domain-containing protein [Candidatus Azobacteroides sp.]
MRKLSLCFLLLFLLSVVGEISAQLSYGGAPLPFSKNTLRTNSSSDNFFISMPSFDVEKVSEEDNTEELSLRKRPLRFAKKFSVDFTPSNSGVHFITEDGTKIWRVGIRSEGAYSLNVLFTEFQLPEGGKLFLYNSDQTKILGAFTEKNNPENLVFPVSPVDGDELVIEYQEPENAPFSAKLRIGEVNHDYINILKRLQDPKDASCQDDAVCRDDVDKEAQAVCVILVNGIYLCSGAMINNTEEDGTPFFLTSCHCMDIAGKTYEQLASTIIVFFNYQSPACNSGIRGTEEMSMSSTIFRAADKRLDFALIELLEIPPADFRPYYLGWSLADSPSGSYIGIHQPNGGVKKVAESNSSITLRPDGWLSINGYLYGQMWQVNQWTLGKTEEGSSGSPLLDGDKRFIGALTGGSSECGNKGSDVYWTFKNSWDYYSDEDKQLKIWLDPNNTGLTEIDGFDPYAEEERCKRISNLDRNESYSHYYLTSPEKGPLFGYNTLMTNEYAEAFTNDDFSYLYGVSLVTPVLRNRSGNKGNIYINVYAGANEPEELLAGPILFHPAVTDYASWIGFEEYTKSYGIAAENYLRFEEPVEVGKKFFVSYQLDYAAIDSFAVYSAKERLSDKNTAYYKMDDKWYPVSEHPGYSMNTSLWINPVLQYRDTSSVGKAKREEKSYYITKTGKGRYNFVWKEELNNITFTVYTIDGKKVLRNLFSGTETDLDISFFPEGIYIIVATDTNGNKILREKIVN